jgi:hypothetical protein
MSARIAGFIRQNVLGLIAIFIALGGTAYASNEWTGDNIVNGSLTSVDYKNLNIQAADLAPDVIPSDDNCPFPGTCFNSSKIADRAVGASEISPGAVGTSEVAPNSLTGSDIDESKLDQAVLQRRVGGGCAPGDAIRVVHADGSIICNPGPAAFYTFVDDTGQICDVGCTEASMKNIPAGTYLLVAKIQLGQEDNDAFTSAHCDLRAGSDPATQDRDFATFTDDEDTVGTLPMEVVHTFDSTDNASITCSDQGVGDVDGGWAKITAIRLGAVNARG